MAKKPAVKTALGLTALCATVRFATGAVAADATECKPSKFGKEDRIGN
jgi:hypothetical protein